jgi:drug/metabolite transporter (DMT)-like permease
VRTVVLTTAALVAFASNSLLCRMALGPGTIDAASFSTVRLASGAVSLLLIMVWTQRGLSRVQGSWTSAAALFLYAIPFSYAYGLLTTGTGALILFGSVQVTMMVMALMGGERPRAAQWIGLVLAVAGVVYLVLPGLAAPSPLGAVLMTLSGVAWAIYSLRGRGEIDPLAQTTGNFVRSVPMTLLVSLAALPFHHLQRNGVLLAMVSGAVTSGLGYVVWYAALRGLSATRASLVQLLPPVLAAAGGLFVLGEPLSLRLVLSTVIVLGGVALALTTAESHSELPRSLRGRSPY